MTIVVVHATLYGATGGDLETGVNFSSPPLCQQIDIHPAAKAVLNNGARCGISLAGLVYKDLAPTAEYPLRRQGDPLEWLGICPLLQPFHEHFIVSQIGELRGDNVKALQES
jgi:hypothetical protein